MTALRLWAVRLLERALGRFSEGPRLPERYRATAEDYRWHVAPFGSTADDWEAFALGLAESAWREAYVRGYEAAERWERPWHRSPTPEEIADAERPGWRDAPPFEPEPR